jgi:hypothetical protein
MNSAIPCPYCGEMMTPPIRFCVGCGRGVTPEDLKNTGLRIGGKRADGGDRFALAKKEYSMHRKMRGMFWTTTAVMAIVLIYYGVMKFGLNEEPWVKWGAAVEAFVARAQGKFSELPDSGGVPTAQATEAPSATAAPVAKPTSTSKPTKGASHQRRSARKQSSKT